MLLTQAFKVKLKQDINLKIMMRILCGRQKGTVAHFIYQCPNYSEDRENMMIKLQRVFPYQEYEDIVIATE